MWLEEFALPISVAVIFLTLFHTLMGKILYNFPRINFRHALFIKNASISKSSKSASKFK